MFSGRVVGGTEQMEHKLNKSIRCGRIPPSPSSPVLLSSVNELMRHGSGRTKGERCDDDGQSSYFTIYIIVFG